MPLSLFLWDRNTALRWLEKIERADGDEHRVFYSPEPERPRGGGCSVYHWRPLICRLVGFSFRRDKNGSPVFMPCKTLKQQHATTLQHLDRLLLEAYPSCPFAPLFMTDYTMMVRGIDPLLGTRQMPINWAARIAIEKTGLMRGIGH